MDYTPMKGAFSKRLLSRFKKLFCWARAVVLKTRQPQACKRARQMLQGLFNRGDAANGSVRCKPDNASDPLRS